MEILRIRLMEEESPGIECTGKLHAKAVPAFTFEP